MPSREEECTKREFAISRHCLKSFPSREFHTANNTAVFPTFETFGDNQFCCTEISAFSSVRDQQKYQFRL